MDNTTSSAEVFEPEPPPPPRKKRRKWPWIVLLSVFVVPALLLGIWTGITMSYTYSDGHRAGYVQKFSRKGWICKTWEGEIAQVNIPGATQQVFQFTVRDDSVAQEINRLQGQRVDIHYKEHRGVPLSCFGETPYFVDGVRAIDAPTWPGQAAPDTSGAPAAPQAPPAPGGGTIDRPPGAP